MSYWNYRVVRHSPEQGEIYYGIHEVYYNEDGSIWVLTESPVDVHGEYVEDLKEGYFNMQEAFDKPVIDFDTREEITL